METRYLNEFIVLAEMQNYFRAAETLSMSQSTLSKHIMALEAELGVSLFDRSGRNIKLSSAGEALLPYSEKIAACEREMTKLIDQSRRAAKQTMTIGMEYRCFESLSDFRRLYPDVIVQIVEPRYYGDLSKYLHTGKCDMAFMCNWNNATDGFETVPYEEDEFVAVVKSTNPLAEREYINMEELKDKDMVLFSADSVHGYIEREIFEKYGGFEINEVFTAVKGHQIITFVKNKNAVGMLFEKSSQNVLRSGDLCTVKIRPSVKVQVNLCYMKDHKLSSIEKALIRYVKSRNETI